MARPRRKTVRAQPPSPLAQATPSPDSRPSDRSQSPQRQRSRSGPATEDDERFDLDAAGSNDDYDDADDADDADDVDDVDDADDANKRPVRRRARTRGVPQTTGSETRINQPGDPKDSRVGGPPDIVHFFGPGTARGTKRVEVWKCKTCK